ncbi:MAG: IgGFc-binding protein [Nannocystaceae bacterium]
MMVANCRLVVLLARYPLVVAGLLASGCLGTGDIHVITGASTDTGTTGESTATGTTSGTTAEVPPDLGEDLYSQPKFDVAPPAASGSPVLPTTCPEAHQTATSLGCIFYPLDLDRSEQADAVPVWVTVINPHTDIELDATIFERVENTWVELEGLVTLPPESSYVYTLPQRHHDGTGWVNGGSFRLATSRPATVYQFSGIDAYSPEGSGASLLLPLSAWGSLYHIMGWQTHTANSIPSYLTVLSRTDGTEVTILPSAETSPGNLIDSGAPNTPLKVLLDDGDFAQIAVAQSEQEVHYGLTGTIVQSGGEHPVAVYSAHACASIPDDELNCNHAQEQLTPYLYGTHFIAPRLPARDLENPESTLWQLYALENSTLVNIAGTYTSSAQSFVMKAGETLEVWSTGDEGSLEISTTREIAITGYLTDHAIEPPQTPLGGPESIMLSPTNRWLSRYGLFTPPGWEAAYATVTRPIGVDVWLDDEVVDSELFTPLNNTYEVANIPLADGMAHFIEADEPILVISLGFGIGSAYASLAGWGTLQPAHEPIP